MYRIIIVDDEINAIEGLKILIDTERNHISEMLTSTNAIEALDIIAKERPDIIISDISMPQMSGLEMIAEIKKIENYNPMIIILSGYSTFTYAQTAMSHGVKAYLLKPVDEDELNDKLDELIGEIEANSQQTFEKNVVLDGALYKILSGDNTKKAISSFLSLLGAENSDMMLLLSEITYKENRDIELSEEELDGDFKKLNSLFESVFMHSSSCKSFKVFGNKMLSVLWGDLDKEKELQLWEEFDKRANSELSVFLNMTCTDIFNCDSDFSKELNGITGTPMKYQGNLFAKDFKELSDMFSNISGNFEALSKDELKKLLEEALDKAISLNISLSGFKTLFNTFIVNISSFVSVDNTTVSELLEQAEALSQSGSLLSNKTSYIDHVLVLYDKMTDYNSKMQNETLTAIINYVNNNFTENITLKSLAQKFYINPIYLGRVFKKQTGTLFNEYLTTLRIERSKVLLKNTNKKVYEIASEIGFNDPNYFIAKFLKTEGVTPSQYRKG